MLSARRAPCWYVVRLVSLYFFASCRTEIPFTPGPRAAHGKNKEKKKKVRADGEYVGATGHFRRRLTKVQ